MHSHTFSKVAKTVAGRVSVIAAEMKAQEEAESKEASNSSAEAAETQNAPQS
jgi:hypothetical protein